MRPNVESSTASGAQASASGSSTAARASTSRRATRPPRATRARRRRSRGRGGRRGRRARRGSPTPRGSAAAPRRGRRRRLDDLVERPAREGLRHHLVRVERLPPDGGQPRRECDGRGAEPGDRRPERPAMIEHVEDCSDRHGSDDRRRMPPRRRSDALVGTSSDNAGWLRNRLCPLRFRLVRGTLVRCRRRGAVPRARPGPPSPCDGRGEPVRLAGAAAIVLLVPGALVQRVLGWPLEIGVALADSLVWSLVLLFVAMAITFAVGASFTLALVLLTGAALGRPSSAGAATGRWSERRTSTRPSPSRGQPAVPAAHLAGEPHGDP